jgi:hypothetical protein
MKAMFAGFAVMGLIAIGAYYGLGAAGFSAADMGSGPNVRLD